MMLGSPTKTENELDHSPIVAHHLSPERPELRSEGVGHASYYITFMAHAGPCSWTKSVRGGGLPVTFALWKLK